MKTAYCFGIDGTLTSAEMLPCLAAEIGVSGEMATLARATVQGAIPFEDALRLSCAILGQIPVAKIVEIASEIPINPHIYKFINANKSNCFLLTGNLDVWVEPIVRFCECQCYSSGSSIKDGVVHVGKVLDKTLAIHEIREKYNVDNVVAIGDGDNDCGMFEAADVSIAFGGVHSPSLQLIKKANYVVNDGNVLCHLLPML